MFNLRRRWVAPACELFPKQRSVHRSGSGTSGFNPIRTASVVGRSGKAAARNGVTVSSIEHQTTDVMVMSGEFRASFRDDCREAVPVVCHNGDEICRAASVAK